MSEHLPVLDPAAPYGPGATDLDVLAVVARHAIFSTVQGEGVYAGVPSVFLRLYGCNLSCSWCDTKNSWTRPDKNRVELGVDSAREQLLDSGLAHWIITGGEPTLQQHGLLRLLKSVELNGHARPKVTLETNGLLPVALGLLSYLHLVSVSPKLHEKQEPKALLERIGVARGEGAKVQIKLVVSNETELDNAIRFMDAATCSVRYGRQLEPEFCFIHPEWSTYGSNFPENMTTKIIESGYRLGYQQHKTWKLR